MHCRDLVSSSLVTQAGKRNLKLLSWVVMPNHIHLILLGDLTADAVASFLAGFKSQTARLVLPHVRLQAPTVYQKCLDSQGRPRLWLRGGGYDRVLFSGEEIREKIAYIEANPVRKGLCGVPEDYDWSSARRYREHEFR